jgi:hypothetical protein
MKKHLFLSSIAPVIALAITLALSSQAFAEIYKHVDADGRVTYSNIKSKGSTRLELDPDANVISNDRAKASSGSTANKRTPTPDSFPRVDKNTQNQRDDKRKEILQNELASEKLALEQAKKAYAEGESKPEVYTANGKTFRNVPKFEEKMKTLQADVDNHQKNIELLQKELDSLK